MGRPRKVKVETPKVVEEQPKVVEELPKVVEEPQKVVKEKLPRVVEEKKKRKYGKKKEKVEDIVKEIEKINEEEFKIEEEEKEKVEEEKIERREIKEREEIKWEKIDYIPMIKKEKKEEKIYTKDEWDGGKIDIYIYHTDISKNKIVSEEMMNEKKFLYQIFIYGREGNECVLTNEKRDLVVQKTYEMDMWNIHLLEDFPPMEEIEKDKWRQYILFYKMDMKEMTDQMKLQRVMRKDLWFYEKYGNLIKMTIDNTYVLEHKIYVRKEGKKYFMNFKIRDLLEILVE